MKASFFRRHRGWVLALLLVPALTFNPINPLVRLSAQTNAAPATTKAAPETASAPATNAPAASATTSISSTNTATASSTNAAPAAPAAPEIDTDSGKPVVTTPSGLKYVELTPGAGPAIKPGDEVTVKYEGRFADGRFLDSSDKHTPDTFSFIEGVGGNAMIPGWTEGIATMKVGGKRKLIIPPTLGYGADGNQAIPPNSTLIYTIEVLSAQPKPAK